MKFPPIHPQLGELITSISQGESEDVVELIAAEPSLVNCVHPSGATPLFFAVRHQTPHILAFLISRGADANPALPGRESLIQLADRLPHQDVFDALREAGGRAKSKRRLLAEKIPVFPTISQLTATDLPLCASVQNSKRFNKLAEELPLRRLRQLLSFACRERAQSLARRLIAFLPSVDYCTDDEGSPLLDAALSGSLQLVKALRSAGAKREIIGAFEFAVERGHVRVAANLLGEIQKAKYKTYFDREVPTMAERVAKKGYTAMAEILMPYASSRTRNRAIAAIEAWREQYFDLPPEHFEWANDTPIETS